MRAGGIGITPLQAARENRLITIEQEHPAVALHYRSAGAVDDAMVVSLQQLTEQLPDISLYMHDSLQGQRLTAIQLQIHNCKVDILFCGPQGLAN